PGPSGDATKPNHANYDEAQANPFPNLHEVLTTKDGKKVTTAEMWWSVRRPEIVEDFDREVLGRVPKDVPKVTWTVENTTEGKAGDRPTITKQLVGHVDNSSCPEINVDIRMGLTVPADAKGPVPVMIMFSFGFGPGGGFGPRGGGGPATRPTAGGPATRPSVAAGG